jgi:hypothetical protein
MRRAPVTGVLFLFLSGSATHYLRETITMNNSNPQFVKLSTGEEAVVLTPAFEGPKAIVDLNTIQRLARLLPEAHFRTIRRDLVSRLEGSDNLTDMLYIMEEELAFHKSVNIITTYKPVAEMSPQELRHH